MLVRIQDEVRCYEEEGWFFTGQVIEVTDGIANVDYGDWIQQYPVESLKEHYILYDRVLLPLQAGAVLVDYRAVGAAA